MSETTDFYMDWLGCGAFGAVGKRGLVIPEPVVFQPTDISNCSVWLDATDNLTIQGTGSNVEKWFNKGDLSGSMVPYSTEAVPTTGIHNINGNNALWFDAYQTLTCNFTMTEQEYTFFVVTTVLSDLALNNYADWFGNYTSGGFSTGLSEYLGDYYTGCGGSGIDNYVMIQRPTFYQNTPVIYAMRSSSNTGTNALWINNVSQTLDFNSFSGYATGSLDFFIHIYTHSSSLDISELIVYNRALSDAEVDQVAVYLSDKYTIT